MLTYRNCQLVTSGRLALVPFKILGLYKNNKNKNIIKNYLIYV